MGLEKIELTNSYMTILQQHVYTRDLESVTT